MDAALVVPVVEKVVLAVIGGRARRSWVTRLEDGLYSHSSVIVQFKIFLSVPGSVRFEDGAPEKCIFLTCSSSGRYLNWASKFGILAANAIILRIINLVS